jgi:hypothetical protein
MAHTHKREQKKENEKQRLTLVVYACDVKTKEKKIMTK